jgi:hypothetical protein
MVLSIENESSRQLGTPRSYSAERQCINGAMPSAGILPRSVSCAAGAGDDRVALTAVRETRASLELVMRAHGMLANDGPTVNIDARPASIAVLSRLSEGELRAVARLGDGDGTIDVFDVVETPIDVEPLALEG